MLITSEGEGGGKVGAIVVEGVKTVLVVLDTEVVDDEPVIAVKEVGTSGS